MFFITGVLLGYDMGLILIMLRDLANEKRSERELRENTIKYEIKLREESNKDMDNQRKVRRAFKSMLDSKEFDRLINYAPFYRRKAIRKDKEWAEIVVNGGVPFLPAVLTVKSLDVLKTLIILMSADTYREENEDDRK